MPVLLSTYSYGNEKAMAFTFTVVAVALAITDWRWKIPLSAASFAAGVFCRPDYLFLGFFWLAWVGLYGGTDRSKQAVIRRVLQAAVVCTIFGGLFWLAFMRYILDPEKWTTKIDRLDVLMVQMEGVRDGSETTEDRVFAEGEGGIGGGAWRPYHQRIGVPIWHSSNADRILEEAVAGGSGRTVFG
jgi:hypothetical protein